MSKTSPRLSGMAGQRGGINRVTGIDGACPNAFLQADVPSGLDSDAEQLGTPTDRRDLATVRSFYSQFVTCS